MGCTARDKYIRTNRRVRSVKPESDDSNKIGNQSRAGNVLTGIKPINYHIPMSKSNRSSVFADNGWGFCTQDQLEEILMKSLEVMYNEAIKKLVGLGYNEEVALKAILRNENCYGGMDVLTNILHNSLTYLTSGGNSEEDSVEDSEPSFEDLRQLEKYSLAGMVCLLQQVKPHLSKGEAMWCLLMSDLHVGRASEMEIPVLPSTDGKGSGKGRENASESVGGNLEGVLSDGGPVGIVPALCRFHGGWGFGNSGTSEFPRNGISQFFPYASGISLYREIECPKRFNLSPSMKNLLKRNVAMFAAGFRANSKQFQSLSLACTSSLSVENTRNVCDANAGASVVNDEKSQYEKNQDIVNSVLSKLRDLNLDGNTEQACLDQKNEMILSLIHQIKDLEEQVKERKEWAHQKAMQAARKLSHDLTELKMLRIKREETQQLKKGKQNLEEASMKNFNELENALRMSSAQVDHSNAVVQKLEAENAELRAEMEASKLSASESISTCLEVAKREKKSLKKILALEKQKTKMQKDIAAEKQKISELQQELAQVEAAAKEAEAKWKQLQKAREVTLEQLEEERHLKESSEASNKRKLESLRLKVEIDFQCHKDDLQRLQQEYAHLKESAEVENKSNPSRTTNCSVVKPHGDTISRMLRKLDQLEDSQKKEVDHNRECMICSKNEVSVVFLPCAHQVICANCNDNYRKKGKAACPYCRAPIQKRIRVYGASS